MKKCLILGGGFAGLTSAVYLSEAGFKVQLIEASPKLGGRAYSFYDEELGAVIDNGQHILMGCYNETLKFLNLIGSLDLLEFQKSLAINFVKKDNNLFKLKAYNLIYPFGLIGGLLTFKALKLSERIRLLSFFAKLPLVRKKNLKNLTVLDWLILEKQNENIRKSFWDFLVIGALNTHPSKASAIIFLNILNQIFLRGGKAATIILPKMGLTETYCKNAQSYIIKRGGEVLLSEKVEEIIINGNSIKKIRTSARVIEDFDFVISALPLFALKKILPSNNKFNFTELEYSSILSIHLKLNDKTLPKTFFGLVDSKVHWVFNHGDHLTLIISDADYLINDSKEEIFEICCEELDKFLGIKRNELIKYRVIKEKRATFIPTNKINNHRPFTQSGVKNFFLAGDWIETGLPSTIESAVKSGKLAADLIMEK